VRLEIEGHTDDRGSTQYNQRLSVARARAVWQYLGTHLKLPTVSVSVVGYGKARPAATNDSEEGRAKNRRVEVLIILSL
jgi:OOP family OmpA-OmpF porin